MENGKEMSRKLGKKNTQKQKTICGADAEVAKSVAND